MLSKRLIRCWISAAADTTNIPLPSGYTTWQCNPSQAAFTKHTHLSNNEPPSLWQRMMNGEKRLFFSRLQVAGIQDQHGSDRRRCEQLRCSTIHTVWQDSVSKYCGLNSLIFAGQHGCVPKECVIHIHLFTLSEPHWDCHLISDNMGKL